MAVDFDQLETRVAKIANEAKTRLERILLDRSTSPLGILIDSNHQSKEQNVEIEYELRLGSTRLSLDEIHALNIGAILPLLSSEQGRVQIVSKDRVCGTGILLVVDGKLALRLVSPVAPL